MLFILPKNKTAWQARKCHALSFGISLAGLRQVETTMDLICLVGCRLAAVGNFRALVD